MPTILIQGTIAMSRAHMLPRYAGPDWDILHWDPAAQAPEEFPALAERADVIIGGSIPTEWPHCPNLKLYQIPWTGFDFTSPEKMPNGVPVANTYEHESCMAEFAMLAMLEWQIGLRHLDSEVRQHGWNGHGPGVAPVHGEIKGKTLGIVGYGHIGYETAMRARAFGMRCIGIRRSARPCPPELDWLGQTDRLEELLAESDFVLIACDLNDETLGLINAERLAAMKPTGVIINLARGRIIDEDALYDALSNRRIGGAVIDTWYNYGADTWPSNRPFHELENTLLAGHRSAVTEEMFERRWQFVAANCARVLAGEAPENVVFTGTAPTPCA